MNLDIVVSFLFFLYISPLNFTYYTASQQYAIALKRLVGVTISTIIITIRNELSSLFNINYLLFRIRAVVGSCIMGNLLLCCCVGNNCLGVEMKGRLKNTPKITVVVDLFYYAAVTVVLLKALAMAISWFFLIEADYGLFVAAILLVIFSVGSCGIELLTLVSVVCCMALNIFLAIIAWLLYNSINNQCIYYKSYLALSIRSAWNCLMKVGISLIPCASFFTCSSSTFYPVQVHRVLTSENATKSIVYINIMLIVFILFGGFLYHRRNLRKLFYTIQTLKSEQEEQNARQFFSKQQVEALAYESSYVLSQVHSQLLRLLHSGDCSLALLIETQATRLRKYFDSIFTHLKHNLHLSTNWISMDQLLEECFDSIKINNIYHLPYVTINSEHLYIQCDVGRIKNLIINSLHSCKLSESIDDGKDDKRKDIFIYVNDTQLGYRLTLLQGKIQKVNAISFVITTVAQQPAILPIYKVIEMANVQILDNTKEKEKIDSENHHIVHAHYGYCEITHSDSAVTYLYVVPVNVQRITKTFATLSPVVYTQNVKLDPTSVEEETVFFKKIKKEKSIDLHTVMDAFQLIKIYYTTQKRKTGELSYLHPVAVASILLDITTYVDVIIAGLVHDVVQNTPLTEAGLTTMFGESVAQLVLAAALLEKKLPVEKKDYPIYIQSILNGKNYNAALIRLADILHNARTIHGHNIEKQIEKATLIQEFYKPLAEQMHLTKVAHELHVHASTVLNTT